MKRKGKVLVVEDSKKWASILEEVLVSNGFFVKIVTSLPDALEVLGTEMFHFVTIDLQLNERTLQEEDFEGWEFIEKILELKENRTMSIMILTGFPGEIQESNKTKAKEKYGISLFMEKSKFDKYEFVSKVIKAVDRHDLRFKDDHRD